MVTGLSEGAPAGGAAFFDLDGTMIPFNSGIRFARFEFRERRIGRLQLLQSAVWMALYRFSLVDMTRAYDKALAHYRGVPARELDDRTRAWFSTEIDAALLPAARDALAAHRAAGEPLVLLSSTSSFLATVASEVWGLDDWLANVFPTDAEGRLTGHFEAPLCYGVGKLERARAWAQGHGVDLAKSSYYGDSLSDAPVLAAVGSPYAVNPDPRLRRLARRRGWPILDWAGR